MRILSETFLSKMLFLVVALVFATGSALAAKRVALVIGNSAYEHTSPLKNPVNDANLMADSLTEAGFEVTKILDADYRTIKKAMLEFGRSLRNSPEAGLFYFAGHGIQVRGKNYLVPVNAKISDEDEVDLEAIDVNSFLRVMDSSSSAINIVVLDACRNNPFARSFRSATRGLASVDAPKGTYVAYATAPGSVASDGRGKNSPYSVALAKAIKIRGLTIEQVFKHARRSVLEATSSKQVPWETSSITGNFFFLDQKITLVAPTVNKPILQQVNPVRDEAENVYKQIKDSSNIEVLEIFSKQFPNSIYTKFARVRIKSLKEQLQTSKPPVVENTVLRDPDSKLSGSDIFKKARKEELKQNYVEAARLYRMSADKGYVYAIYNLGVFYANGSGVKQDFYESSRLYKIGVSKGHLNATYNLAIAYSKGRGVTKDYLEAARLYRIAVNKKHVNATRNLGLLYKNGQGVTKDYKEAGRLFEKAANLNSLGAMYDLGSLYYSGNGVPNDKKKAAEWIFKSLNKGYEFALNDMLKNAKTWNLQFRIEFQREMKRTGYYPGIVDGDFGPATMDAMRRAAKG
jgi:TPR repeat protein